MIIVDNQKPIFVSYYTKGSLYEKEAKDLIASLDKFGLKHDICAIEDKGSWSKNCCYKPEFILKKLEQHNAPLVWTDADSIVVQKPVFFDDCYADVSFRVNDHVPPEDEGKILTGTFFANNTPSAKKLLQLWEKECMRMLDSNKEKVMDQVALRRVVLHYPTIVEMKRLPEKYIRIVRNAEDRTNTEDGVIVHYQASRLTQKFEENDVSAALLNGLSSEELKRIHTE